MMKPAVEQRAYMKLVATSFWRYTSIQVATAMVNIGLISLASCDEDVDPACNCSGNGNLQLVNESAIVVSTMDGFRFLSPTTGLILPCVPIDGQTQVDGLMVHLDGTIKATCDEVNALQTINYTDIAKVDLATDSVFNKSPFGISIIRSEAYGYGPGYGYKIFPSVGLKIVQPTMPAVQGFKPFKNATDAFKTAVLVSRKLHQNNSELPTIEIADLVYLQVIH